MSIDEKQRFALIDNDLNAVFNLLTANPVFTLNGDGVTLDVFKTKAAELLNDGSAEVVLIDDSYFADAQTLINAVTWLRCQNSKMRYIIAFTAQPSQATIAAIARLGVYDLVYPTEKFKDTKQFESAISEDITLAVNSPKGLSSYVDLISAPIPAEGEAKKPSLPRVLLYFKNFKFSTSFAQVSKPYLELVEAINYRKSLSVDKLRFLEFDYLMIENPDQTELTAFNSALAVTPAPINTIVFYSNAENLNQAKAYTDFELYLYNNTKDLKFFFDNTFQPKKVSQLTQPAETDTGKKGKPQPTIENSKTIVVSGAKGGVGTTTMVNMIASNLRQKGRDTLKICVVDFRLTPGTLGATYQIFPHAYETPKNLYSYMHDLIENRRKGYRDEALLNQLMNYVEFDPEHQLYVLPTPDTDFDAFTPEEDSDEDIIFALKKTIEALEKNFDVVIYDTPLYSNCFDLIASSVTRLFLVSDLTFASVYTLKAALPTLTPELFPRLADRSRLIINRAAPDQYEYEKENLGLVKEFWKKPIFTCPYDSHIVKHDNYVAKEKYSGGVKKFCSAVVNDCLSL